MGYLQNTCKHFVIDNYSCNETVVTWDQLEYHECHLSFTVKDHHFLCVNSGVWGLAKCELV